VSVNERISTSIPAVGDILGARCTEPDCDRNHGGPDDAFHIDGRVIDIDAPPSAGLPAGEGEDPGDPPRAATSPAGTPRFPDFEGRPVRHGSAHLSATIPDADRAYELGETIIVVGRYKVTDVHHPLKDGQLRRKQILSGGEDVYELTDAAVKEFLGDAIGHPVSAEALVAAAQTEAADKADARGGALKLPFLTGDEDQDDDGEPLPDPAAPASSDDTATVRLIRRGKEWFVEFPDTYPPPEGTAAWNTAGYATLAEARGMVETRIGDLDWRKVGRGGEYEAALPEPGDES